MSQVETSANPATGAKLSIGQAVLRGRIVARRAISTKNGRQYITIAKLPAPDEFTSPQTVELRSQAPVGEAGELVTVRVQLGGYGRTYQAQDPETGEKRTVQTADNTYTVIEG